MVRAIVCDAFEPVFAVGLGEVLRRDGHEADVTDQLDFTDLEADVVVVGIDDSGVFDPPDGPCGRCQSCILLVCQCVTSEILRLTAEHDLSGVVTRCSPLPAICAAVVAVSSGLFVFPAERASLIANGVAQRRPNLTELEKTILTAISTGTIDQVASKIGYSRRHTQRVVSNILHDLELPDTRSALIAAGAWGLIPIPHLESDQ